MNFADAKFLSIGRLSPQPDWQMASHTHRNHELIIILDGELAVEIRGQTRRAQAGELLWYPAGVPHREWTHPQAPAETLFIALDWPTAAAAWPIQQTDHRGRITELARWLFAERESQTAVRQVTINPFLHAILAEYERLATHKDDPLVTGTRAYIRQHLAKPLTLDELSLRVSLSKFHFVRRYKTLTGRTPMEDARYIRLQAARDLLLTTALPLKEIGPQVGLGDEYRLCRLFRKHFHTTPGTLRQRRGAVRATRHA
jgi:AraC-like DNA-binding protein